MRTQTNIITRNFGVLEEEPIKGNKVYASGDEPILEDLGEGEFILDRNKNRPLVKVGGELKQMRVDDNGYVFYDTPIDSSMVQSLSQALEQINSGLGSYNGEVFYIRKLFNMTNVTLGSNSINTFSGGTTIKSILLFVKTAFVGTTTITATLTLGANTIMEATEIDLTEVGARWSLNQLIPILSIAEQLKINFSGTASATTAALYLMVEYVNGIYL